MLYFKVKDIGSVRVCKRNLIQTGGGKGFLREVTLDIKSKERVGCY